MNPMTNKIDLNIIRIIINIKMIVKEPNTFRQNINDEIYKFLKNKKKSKNVEKGIYNFAVKKARDKNVVRKWDNEYFVQIYVDRFRSIYNNINPEIAGYNKELYKNIKSSKFDLKKLETMTHKEMNFKVWKVIIDEQLKRVKNMANDDMSAATDQYYCHKCKERKCVYYQIQIRSSDEPMTTFISCLVCGNNWKE